jgi:hypothetical protein
VVSPATVFEISRIRKKLDRSSSRRRCVSSGPKSPMVWK